MGLEKIGDKLSRAWGQASQDRIRSRVFEGTDSVYSEGGYIGVNCRKWMEAVPVKGKADAYEMHMHRHLDLRGRYAGNDKQNEDTLYPGISTRKEAMDTIRLMETAWMPDARMTPMADQISAQKSPEFKRSVLTHFRL